MITIPRYITSTLSGAVLALSLTLTAQPSLAALPVAVNGQEMPTLAPILEKATPAVVNISVAGTKALRQQMTDPLEFFFGQRRPQQSGERPFKGLGSGVIIDAKQGLVITNNHVIADADEITVTLTDGREFDAKVLGKDKHTDIALLKIEADDLTEIPMANSDALRVGDFAIAIGNPFGLGQTVTSGIVSALARSGLSIEVLENFIQTDAAINQGNSGGALINLRGELIGINTAIIAPGGGNIGIGFAIPANMVKDLSKQLLEHGEVRRGMLGIMGQELTADLAKAFGSTVNQGAFVSQVMPGSAAQDAGIQAGDVITQVDNKPVKSFAELRARIATAGVGKKMKLTIIRDGKQKQFNVVLRQSENITMQAQQLHPVLEGAQLGSTTEKDGILGAKVTKVAPRSPAARAGLEEGDIIVRVNRKQIDNLRELENAIKSSAGKALALNIKRGGASLYLVIN